MKINKISEIRSLSVEIDDKQYYRYGKDAWYVKMGDSDEPVYDCEELEQLYQEYIKFDIDKPTYPWPEPKPQDLESRDFNLIWECIKTWDINVPAVYNGYCGANGNHVMSILFATGKRSIQDYASSSS